MEEINQLVSPETQALILQCLTIASLVLPMVERVVEKTTNKWDDKVVHVIKTVLSILPRVTLRR